MKIGLAMGVLLSTFGASSGCGDPAHPSRGSSVTPAENQVFYRYGNDFGRDYWLFYEPEQLSGVPIYVTPEKVIRFEADVSGHVTEREVASWSVATGTGFDLSFRPRLPKVHHKGWNIERTWHLNGKSSHRMGMNKIQRFLGCHHEDGPQILDSHQSIEKFKGLGAWQKFEATFTLSQHYLEGFQGLCPLDSIFETYRLFVTNYGSDSVEIQFPGIYTVERFIDQEQVAKTDELPLQGLHWHPDLHCEEANGLFTNCRGFTSPLTASLSPLHLDSIESLIPIRMEMSFRFYCEGGMTSKPLALIFGKEEGQVFLQSSLEVQNLLLPLEGAHQLSFALEPDDYLRPDCEVKIVQVKEHYDHLVLELVLDFFNHELAFKKKVVESFPGPEPLESHDRALDQLEKYIEWTHAKCESLAQAMNDETNSCESDFQLANDDMVRRLGQDLDFARSLREVLKVDAGCNQRCEELKKIYHQRLLTLEGDANKLYCAVYAARESLNLQLKNQLEFLKKKLATGSESNMMSQEIICED